MGDRVSRDAKALRSGARELAHRSHTQQFRRRDDSFANRHRQREWILRHGHSRVFEQIPCLDQHAAPAIAHGAQPGPLRHKANGLAAQDALLVQPKQIIRERHAAGELGHGNHAVLRDLQIDAGADRRQRPLMRP